jgi:hypothetical protein
MNFLALVEKFCHLSRKENALRTTGWGSLLVIALAISACGPNGETTQNLKNDASPPAVSTVTPPPAPPQRELAAAFDASTTTLLEAKTAADFAKFKALSQVVLAPEANGLRITSSGTDPQILLPPFAEGKRCIVQLAINLPIETPVQIFYSLRDHQGFTEAQSQLVPLKKGKNIVYFQLDQPDLIDPVRLDPGASPGDYIIESVVAKSITNPARP